MRVSLLAPSLALALLSACEDPAGGGKPVQRDEDTAVDTADTGDTDSGDTDSGDPPDTGPATHAWPGSLDASDLTVTGCGSEDNGVHAIAPGPDLDGDGLGELAVGAPGYDGVRNAGGAVYFHRGSAVADGLRVWEAAAVVTPAESTTGFGSRVTWVGDRDGDGVDDLVVSSTNGGLWTVSGADLLAGGEVTPRALVSTTTVRFARWADVDYDGVDDWLFGYTRDSGNKGAVSIVRDAEFTLDGITRSETAYGTDSRSGAGEFLAALHEDWDGDGLPELATVVYDDLHVISSAALLAGTERLVDAALTTAHYLSDHQLLAPGDLDGDGLDELVVFAAGNKVCVLNGADPTGDAKICIRDEGLGPAEAILGDDVDHDGVGDLWFTRDGWLVAQDLGALAQGIELELARVLPPDTTEALAAGDGIVWASPTAGLGAEGDIAWAWSASFSPQRATTLRGGKWGGTPSVPTWRDVTGDGVVDLVLGDADGSGVALFDGASLAAGGEVTWCDAAADRQWPGSGLAWVDDVDGDGADDALLTTYQGDGTYLQEVWSGPVAVGAAEGDTPITSWVTSSELEPLPGCDLDGDGQEDLVAGDRGVVLYSGALGEDGTFPVLGELESGTSTGCIPDVDGDGGDELYNYQREKYRLYRSSQLDPALVVAQEDAWIALEGAYLSVPAPLRAADGSGLVGWWFEAVYDYELCVLDLAGLSGNVDADDEGALPQRCVDGRWGNGASVTAWLDDVEGDTTPDIVLFGDDASGATSYRVVDGATLGTDTLLVQGTPDYAGPGPDVLGVGARAIWGLGDDPDQSDSDRTRLDVLYARAAEETP